MHIGLHPKSDIDRLYNSRKEGGRGLVSCESTIGSEENNLDTLRIRMKICFKE